MTVIRSIKVVSNYITPLERCTDRAPPIISTLCAISFNLLRKQFERFVLEKLVFRGFRYPIFRLRFFRFVFRKERAEPVILVCRKLESVHGARRTKQKRISHGAMQDPEGLSVQNTQTFRILHGPM